MGKKKLVKWIAVILAVVVAFTSMKEIPLQATHAAANSEGEQQKALLNLSQDQLGSLVDRAKKAGPITDFSTQTKIESQELQNAIMNEDSSVYLLSADKYDQGKLYLFMGEDSQEQRIYQALLIPESGIVEDPQQKLLEVGGLECQSTDTITYTTDTEAGVQTGTTDVQDTTQTTGDDDTTETVEPVDGQTPEDGQEDGLDEDNPGEDPEDDQVNETRKLSLKGTAEGSDEVPTSTEDVQENENDTREALLSICADKTSTADTSVETEDYTNPDDELTGLDPEIGKTADYVSTVNGQSKYKITLSVAGKSKSETISNKADVIFVVDASGSMDYDMEGDSRYLYNEWGKPIAYNGKFNPDEIRWNLLLHSLDGMVDALLPEEEVGNDTNHVSVVAFAGTYAQDEQDYGILCTNGTDADAVRNSYHFKNSTRYEVIKDIYKNENDNGGTNTKAGFIGALEELEKYNKNDPNRKKYVIFLSDGEPTYCTEYENEYTKPDKNEEYLSYSWDSYDENFNYTTASVKDKYGDGRSNWGDTQDEHEAIYSRAIQETKNTAHRLNEIPNTKVCTIGIGTLAETSIILNCSETKENGGFDKTYYLASKASDLEEVFKTLTTEVTNYYLKDVVATDPLSKYVKLDEESTVYLTLSGKDDKTPLTKAEIKNGFVFKDKSGNTVAEYNNSSRTVIWHVTNNTEDSMSDNETRALTFQVTTTEMTKTANNYKTVTGCMKSDQDTGTHAGEYGYPSNLKAYVTYNEKGKKYFPRPVVQNSLRGSLTIIKELDRDYPKLSKDTKYEFEVILKSEEFKNVEKQNISLKLPTGEAQSAPAITYDKTNGTAIIKELYLKRDSDKNSEEVTIGNLPTDVEYTITELPFSGEYYESKGTQITASDGAEIIEQQNTEYQFKGKLSVTTTDKEARIYSIDRLVTQAEDSSYKIRWFNHQSGQEIVDPTIIEECNKKFPVTTPISLEIGKETNGMWHTLGDSEKEKLVENARYQDESLDTVYLTNKKTTEFMQQTLTFFQGEKADDKVSAGVAIKDNGYERTAGFQYDYMNEKLGCRRPCYWSRWSDAYKDVETHNKLSSTQNASVNQLTKEESAKKYKIKSYYENGYCYIDLRGKLDYGRCYSRCTAKFYQYSDGNKYSSAQELITKLESLQNNKFIVLDQQGVIHYTTYNTLYKDLDSYLVDECKYQRGRFKNVGDLEINGTIQNGLTAAVTYTNVLVPLKGSITIVKTIKEDETDDNTFIFKITKTGSPDSPDSPGEGLVLYKSITIEKNNKSAKATINDLPLGKYKIEELDHMRYTIDTREDGNVAEHSVTITKDARNGEISISNSKVSSSGFSDSAVAVNTGNLDLQNKKFKFNTTGFTNIGLSVFRSLLAGLTTVANIIH